MVNPSGPGADQTRVGGTGPAQVHPPGAGPVGGGHPSPAVAPGLLEAGRLRPPGRGTGAAPATGAEVGIVAVEVVLVVEVVDVEVVGVEFHREVRHPGYRRTGCTNHAVPSTFSMAAPGWPAGVTRGAVEDGRGTCLKPTISTADHRGVPCQRGQGGWLVRGSTDAAADHRRGQVGSSPGHPMMYLRGRAAGATCLPPRRERPPTPTGTTTCSPIPRSRSRSAPRPWRCRRHPGGGERAGPGLRGTGQQYPGFAEYQAQDRSGHPRGGPRPWRQRLARPGPAAGWRDR